MFEVFFDLVFVFALTRGWLRDCFCCCGSRTPRPATPGSAPGLSRAQLVAIGIAVVLLPVTRLLPGLASLGLLTAFVTALVRYEWLTQYSGMVFSE